MKQYRLNRLFNASSKRCFDVAVDHGFFNQPGFLQGIAITSDPVAGQWAAGWTFYHRDTPVSQC